MNIPNCYTLQRDATLIKNYVTFSRAAQTCLQDVMIKNFKTEKSWGVHVRIEIIHWFLCFTEQNTGTQ